ncbi:hypothetical protein [Lysobacter enzymogenes]|uniref:hypothetical protein n=1 Tax=Lysobacter enzymogenes TaxID=69 RepID=UPI001AFB7775|nr:hypothetical protein [Lysobacter enzymogenes]QQP99967.1 hypothetical protein JHW41_17905 [Lysobacter enzymogenes]
MLASRVGVEPSRSNGDGFFAPDLSLRLLVISHSRWGCLTSGRDTALVDRMLGNSMNRSGGTSTFTRALAPAALAFAACVAASCSTAGTSAAGRGGRAADPASAVTVENLLRWSVQGPAGIAKIRSGLTQTFEMKPSGKQGLYGAGPVRLTDGYTLNFSSIRGLTGAIHIGVEERPCYSPDRAASFLPGVSDRVELDAHMIDRGKNYVTERNGFRVYFNTTPDTYQCVTSIHIRPSEKANP